ncbi:GNAT family N-acetyltransferase [Bacillus sp. ISL-37]|nr:GNAT family N-acetyltransferase [Bacillus sp. ISL-37]
MSDYIKEIRALIGSRPFILVGSAVLVFNRKYEVLLQLRTDTGRWGIPGGAMEPGESFEDTARRELLEETGLLLKRLKFLDVAAGKEYKFRYPNGDEIHNAIALYACEEWEGELQMLDGESRDLRFFPMDKLPPLTERQELIINKINDSGLLPEIREINLEVIMECAEVLDLQRKSYKIEAGLIGTDEIPPLKETFEQLQDCGETFIGCYIEGRLAGAVSFKKEGEVIDIYRMMVHPEFFRRGIAQKLIAQLEQIGYSEIIVSTGAANTPAVKLYEKLGFERQEDSVVGNGLALANFIKRQV